MGTDILTIPTAPAPGLILPPARATAPSAGSPPPPRPPMGTPLLSLAFSDEGARRVAAIEPAIDRQLDVFFRVDYDPTRPGPESAQFDDEFLALLPALQIGVLLACSRFIAGPFPTKLYPHAQLHRFIAELSSLGPKSPARVLLAEAQRQAPRTWAALLDAARRVQDSSKRGGWPTTTAARDCLQRLDDLAPLLQSIASRKRATKEWGKDPAHLRALHWSQLFARTLTCLASPEGGPLRLWLNYQMSLLEYFEWAVEWRRKTGVDTPSARAIVVEEVYSFVSNHALDEGAGDTEPLGGNRGRGHFRYRKNNQRARLKAQIHMLERGTRNPITWFSDRAWDEYLSASHSRFA